MTVEPKSDQFNEDMSNTPKYMSEDEFHIPPTYFKEPIHFGGHYPSLVFYGPSNTQTNELMAKFKELIQRYPYYEFQALDTEEDINTKIESFAIKEGQEG